MTRILFSTARARMSDTTVVAAKASNQWYALACRLIKASTAGQLLAVLNELGRRPSRSQLCTLRRLARIHPRIGDLLDEHEAPWRVVRRIVHGRGHAEQRERARVELAALVERRQGSGEASRLELALLEVLDEPDLNEWKDLRTGRRVA